MTVTEKPTGNLYNADASPPRSQRIFTEKDELDLLRSFSKVAKTCNSTEITTATIKQFTRSLRIKFSDTQLTDKLRRLRRKYRKMTRSKARIRSVHDRKVYEISRNIWGKHECNGDGLSRKGGLRDVSVSEEVGDRWVASRERNGEEFDGQGASRRRVNVLEMQEPDDGVRGRSGEDHDGRACAEMDSVEGMRVWLSDGEMDGRDEMRGMNEKEDGLKARNENARKEVDLNNYPFLLKEFSMFLPENPVWREGFKDMSEDKLKVWNDKWKKVQIEEARVMAKRADMLQEQMKELLEFA